MKGCLSLIVFLLALLAVFALMGFGWELGEKLARSL